MEVIVKKWVKHIFLGNEGQKGNIKGKEGMCTEANLVCEYQKERKRERTFS